MNNKNLTAIHPRLDKLFLHFFDTHFIEDKGVAAKSAPFFEEMRLATRLAVASADCVYIPAASYYESPLCRKVLEDLEDLISLGFISLAGSAINLEEYLKERQDESFYRKGSVQHSWYRTTHDAVVQFPYVRRARSATRDVTTHWRQIVSDESLARKLRDAVGVSIPGIDVLLESVPDELGGLAFIPEHVFEIVNTRLVTSPLVQARIRSVINEGYFESYTRDLNSGVIVDLHHLASDFIIPSYGQNLSYRKMLRFLRGADKLREFSSCQPAKLLQFGRESEWQQEVKMAMTYVELPMDKGVSKIYVPSSQLDKFGGGNKLESKNMRSVLCIAAAHVEFSTAILKLTKEFGDGKILYVENRQHYVVEFMDKNSGGKWYLAGQSFQGQVDAALTVASIKRSLQPTITLMVGMCMGMPNRELSVGTVIVPNEVTAFDHQRLTAEGATYRPHGDRVDNSLYRLARIVSAKKRSYKIVADKGLASASIKIENSNAALVSTIQSAFPDAVAFDMEGSGFYRANGDDESLWIKAVADSGEAQGSTSEEKSEKHQLQEIATDNSVDFAIALVQEYFASQPLLSR